MITTCSSFAEDNITSFAFISGEFSLGLEQVFQNSLEFEAMYLMTLLVGLSQCAHTMLKIKCAASGYTKEGASFKEVFALPHRCDSLHSSRF